MANRYVYSGAAGTGSGADWTNAHTTLAAAITAGAAGDHYWLAHDHLEQTAGAVTLSVKGTAASPDRYICVNRAGSMPPVAADITTGAVVATSGNNALTVASATNGHNYFEGIRLAAAYTGGSAATTANVGLNNNQAFMHYKKCVFDIGGNTNASSRVNPTANANASTFMEACTFKFGATGQMLGSSGGRCRLVGTGNSILDTGSLVPTTFALWATDCRVEGYDLSSLASLTTNTASQAVIVLNCKLSTTSVYASAPTNPSGYFDIVGSHTTTGQVRNERYMYGGTLTTETTIVRTSGASDGTNSYSWKIVPNTNNEYTRPVETFEGAVWNTTTGAAKTLTVHVVTDGVTLTDEHTWLEADYLGTTTAPVSTRVSDVRATILTTPANQATSTEAWTTTGLASPVYQKLECTFTPQMAGPIRWRVRHAHTTATVYICPKAELS